MIPLLGVMVLSLQNAMPAGKILFEIKNLPTPTFPREDIFATR